MPSWCLVSKQTRFVNNTGDLATVHVHVCYAFFVDCFWMLSAILEYTAYNNLVQLFSNQDKVVISPMELPNRMEGSYIGTQALLRV